MKQENVLYSFCECKTIRQSLSEGRDVYPCPRFWRFVAVLGGFVGLKSVDSDVSDESFMGGKYVGTFVPVVPVLLESPIYSANVSCFPIVKMVFLLYDLSVDICVICGWCGND